MAQTTIDSALIRKLTSQTGYEEVFEQAAHEQAWELLSGTLADANITNRALEKKRDYCKRIKERGIPNGTKFFMWNMLQSLKNADATATLDPDNIMGDFSKLKTGADGAFEVFAGIQAGDELQEPINTEAQERIISSGVPTQNAEFIGQEYLDKPAKAWYKSVEKGTGGTDWVKL